MVRGLCGGDPRGDDTARETTSPRPPSGGGDHRPRRTCMTWTTPTATDFRFGFEITMYVAAR